MDKRLSRRTAMKTVAVSVATPFPTDSQAKQSVKVKTATFTYKRVGKLEVKADVFRADDNTVRPVIVWIHGGALINGHRAGISGRVRKHALENGYVLVSIDYRLAPETQLPGIIEDLEDAFKWIRKDGSRLFHADTSRIAVTGGSAGGCLTLTSGFRVSPPPTVLVSFWGYGDLVGDWYSKPSPHARHNRRLYTRSVAYEQVNGPPVSDSRNRQGNGGVFYNYCRQRGIWPTAVSGWDPISEAEKFFPFMAVKNVSPDYPPTMLVHGTEDTDVPYQQSVMMAQEFKKHGVEYEFASIPGGEHGLAGGDSEQINRAYESAFAFLDRHMGK